MVAHGVHLLRSCLSNERTPTGMLRVQREYELLQEIGARRRDWPISIPAVAGETGTVPRKRPYTHDTRHGAETNQMMWSKWVLLLIFYF